MPLVAIYEQVRKMKDEVEGAQNMMKVGQVENSRGNTPQCSARSHFKIQPTN